MTSSSGDGVDDVFGIQFDKCMSNLWSRKRDESERGNGVISTPDSSSQHRKLAFGDEENIQESFEEKLGDRFQRRPFSMSYLSSLFNRKTTGIYDRISQKASNKSSAGSSLPFADMNAMNRRVGIKLSRKGHNSSFYRQPLAHRNNATIRGDDHLAKLDAKCNEKINTILASMSADNKAFSNSASILDDPLQGSSSNSRLGQSQSRINNSILSSEAVSRMTPPAHCHPLARTSLDYDDEEEEEEEEDSISQHNYSNDGSESRLSSSSSFTRSTNTHTHTVSKAGSGSRSITTHSHSQKSKSSDNKSQTSAAPDDFLSATEKLCNLILVKSEVLQLQGNFADAIASLSAGYSMIQSRFKELSEQETECEEKPIAMFHHISYSATPLQIRLKKINASIHRRLGSLYKVSRRMEEAEIHTSTYITLLEEIMLNPEENSIENIKELALGNSNLAIIYDQLDQAEKSRAADHKALELLSLIPKG